MAVQRTVNLLIQTNNRSLSGQFLSLYTESETNENPHLSRISRLQLPHVLDQVLLLRLAQVLEVVQEGLELLGGQVIELVQVVIVFGIGSGWLLSRLGQLWLLRWRRLGG